MPKGVTSKKTQINGSKTKPIAKDGKFIKKITCYRTAKEYFQMDDQYRDAGFATKAIHGGNNPDPVHGGVAPVIDLSATYAQTQPGELSTCFDYLRCGNQTILQLQRNLASMEGANYAFAFASGMAAIVTLLSLLKPTDHLLIIDDVYAGTQRYLRKVFGPQTGIKWDMIDFTDIKHVEASFKKNTRFCWIESPTNPTLKCVDIAAVGKICKKKGVSLIIDNTFMSPAL
jgi:cystathionine gamma-lyase